VAGSVPASGVCEFPTDYMKAAPEVLCGVYQPTFLYEILWNLGVALVVVLADRRCKLGGGRAFALYVAGYTLGRTWIEMLRIDPANHIFGLRINVFTSVIVFIGAVVFLILRRHVGREDPALVWGPDRPGKDSGRARPAPSDEPEPQTDADKPTGHGETELPTDPVKPEGPGLR
jgi:prolipoprotein diacylglyceryltransferase